jgi:hypothetical protein
MAEGHVCGPYTTNELGGLEVHSPRKILNFKRLFL